jgi:hypothetical protein
MAAIRATGKQAMAWFVSDDERSPNWFICAWHILLQYSPQSFTPGAY